MRPNKILIVYEKKTITDMCRNVLRGEGYLVKCAVSHEEAMNVISSEEFHLVIQGMNISGLKGDEIFLALKEKQQELIGVLIIEKDRTAESLRLIKKGFSSFIEEPFTPDELIQVVSNAFDTVSIIRENARLKTLMPLYMLGEKFIISQSSKEVLDELVNVVSHQTGSQRISVMLYDEKKGYLTIAASKGIDEKIISTAKMREGEKIAGWVFKKGEPVILNRGPRDNPEFASFLKHKDIVAAISFPLRGRNKILGVLNVSKIGKGYPFRESDIEMLSVICGQAVMALENIRIMEEREEKIRLQTLFEQYVSPQVANLMIDHGHNLLDVGEIRNITVLFADMRNFTLLVQHVPLKKLRLFLNNFFGIFSEAVFKFEGTLDKYLGDAALAFFGAPAHHNDPHNAAVSASVEIRRRFDQIISEWIPINKIFKKVGLGIGISSGEMFLGNVGSRRRLDYTVIGVDVNLAQRLASEASSDQILITETIRDALDSKFLSKQEPDLSLRGFEKPIPVFSIRYDK